MAASDPDHRAARVSGAVPAEAESGHFRPAIPPAGGARWTGRTRSDPMTPASVLPPPQTRESTGDAPDDLPVPVELTDDERALLLDVACAAVAVAAGASTTSALWAAVDRHPPTDRQAAAFVTLTEDGELRGCVGHLAGSTPVCESVIEAATWATRGDPRFMCVMARELPGIHVDVSVLGPLVRLPDPMAFRLGTDGIVVERRGRRGLLLPEVAPMHGFDHRAMLETACRKAGLAPGAWRDPATSVYAFRTQRFGGAATGDGSA
jgi:AmmeMemoRadiSam system protein A